MMKIFLEVVSFWHIFPLAAHYLCSVNLNSNLNAMKEILTDFVREHYAETVLWLGITYGGLMIAVAVDLFTGIRKARKNGERLHSSGLKRSCRKMADYVLPMIALTMVDLIIVAVVKLPVLTMAYGAFCVVCEVVSIMERSWEKRRLREMLSAAKKVSKREIVEALEEILNKSI